MVLRGKRCRRCCSRVFRGTRFEKHRDQAHVAETAVNPDAGYGISNFWGPRRETSKELAERSLACILGLQAIDPVFSEWFIGKEGRGFPLSLNLRTLEAEISGEAREDGLALDVKTQQCGSGSRNFNFDIRGGSSVFFNCAVLHTDFGREPDPRVINYSLFLAALLKIAEAFEVERAYAYSVATFKFRAPSTSIHPAFPISWISYVAPRLTHLVIPPPTAIVEYRPNGGLLLAATREVFDVRNEHHMSVARDIAAGAKALDGRPWEPE